MRRICRFLAAVAGLGAGTLRAAPAETVLIPAGTYAAPWKIEAPVEVAPFRLEARAVTNGDYLEFVRANPAWRRSRVTADRAEPTYLARWRADLEPGPRAPQDAPVVEVSWTAASAYAAWRGMRLPTTAEWERAAAIGFTRMDGAREAAWGAAALDWFAVPTPAVLPAAAGRPDLLGVSHLTDLVWEWVEDFATTLPEGASCGGGDGVRDFTNYPEFMRAAFRSSLRAADVAPNLGFRCAASLTPIAAAADEEWTDDRGQPFAFAALHGRPVVVAMIFTRCGYACPLLVRQLQELEAALPPGLRGRARFVLASFDSDNDGPAALRAYRELHRLDPDRWVLLHGNAAAVRGLAQQLGVSYRAVGMGMFAHTSEISILDGNGGLAWQRASLAGATTTAVQAVRAAAGTTGT